MENLAANTPQHLPPDRGAWPYRIGLVLSGLFALFMAFDTAIKLLRLPIVGETLAGLGWSPHRGFAIGVIELIALILYLVPATTLLGAILMTAIMGGAIATNLRLDLPLFSHVLFGVYLGAGRLGRPMVARAAAACADAVAALMRERSREASCGRVNLPWKQRVERL